MAALLPSPQLTRRSCVKRRSEDMSSDLKSAVKKLRELTDRLNSSLDQLSIEVQPLAELLSTQTSMIEALSLQKPCHCRSRSSSRSVDKHATRDRHRREYTYNKHDHQYTVVEDTTRIVYGPTPIASPVYTESPRSARSSPASEASSIHGSPRLQVPVIKTPIPSPRLRLPVAEISYTPPSPPSSPPPPPPPPKDDKYAQPLRHKNSALSVNTDRSNNSNGSSAHINGSCTACDNRPWHLLNRTDPRDSDVTCESHVQEATASLIAAMKERKRTPIGPLDGGTFNLYSSDYRKHYCVHDRPDRQSLLVYSESKTWEDDFPGVPAPVAGEVAMELVVYPDCLLIVKPFRIPKYAGWKWHTLDAIGDNANPTTLEVMFLGNGFIKVRVRLSELLGQDGMDGEPERFIEFAGIWSQSENGNGSREEVATFGEDEDRFESLSPAPLRLPGVSAKRSTDFGDGMGENMI